MVSNVSTAGDLIPLAARYSTVKKCQGRCHWEIRNFSTNSNLIDYLDGYFTLKSSGLYRIDVTLFNGRNSCHNKTLLYQNGSKVSETWVIELISLLFYIQKYSVKEDFLLQPFGSAKFMKAIDLTWDLKPIMTVMFGATIQQTSSIYKDSLWSLNPYPWILDKKSNFWELS